MCRDLWPEYEQSNIVGFTPYVELVDFIRENKSNCMFVYSSNSRSVVEAGLEELGILQVFDRIITRDDVSKVKPDPEGLCLLEGFEESKDDYLMVGDSDGDREVARVAEIDFLKCDYFGTYDFSR